LAEAIAARTRSFRASSN